MSNPLSIDREAYRYGTTPEQTKYSLRVARALTKAGIPDVIRCRRTWFDDPKTAQWEVSFPNTWRTTARRVTDSMYTPSERRRIRENRSLNDNHDPS